MLDLVIFGRSCAHTLSKELKPNSKTPRLPNNAGMKSIENFDKVNVNLFDRFAYVFKYIFYSRKKYIIKKNTFEKKFYNFIIAEYN